MSNDRNDELRVTSPRATPSAPLEACE
jgi:hypothetical protein